MLDEGCSGRSTRQAYYKVLAQTKQLVVPALTDLYYRQVREVRMLLLEQRPHDGRIERDVGSRFRPACHVMPTIIASVMLTRQKALAARGLSGLLRLLP